MFIIHHSVNDFELYTLKFYRMANAQKTRVPKHFPPKKRFNYWWIYIFILLLLLLPSLLNKSATGKETTWQQFEKEMLSRGAVDKIVVVNNEKAEIYIKKEFAGDSIFKKVMKPLWGSGIKPGPHFSFTIGSVESFEKKLEEAEKKYAAAEERSDF